ncbi:hypothetical protein Q428_03665 [Fervidicella metallireducens AeB]|uniref:TVP38/TMEM64 family membrane protein n=1 Tax=Fervidicella metallireducens AeB TaxID=1403537 RepID=A0A017RXW6_9CLOT|nr:TVP38/TMEM64 family protein [Fervidicella metallireducens]EYE89249.1 hypothetical protein Q428_03665 [Fervidicella metallireducens AeB]
MKIKKVFSLLMFCVIIILCVFIRNEMLTIVSSPQNLRHFLLVNKKLSVLIYLILSATRTLIFLPAGMYALASGLTFGSLLGTLLTAIGTTLSGIIAFYISKFWGRDFIQKILGNRAKNIDGIIKNNGIIYVIFLRIVPILPFDAVSYAAGLTQINIFDFAVGTLIGSLPGAFVYNYLGSNIMNFNSVEFKISVIIFVSVSLVPIIYKYIIKKG